MVNGKQRQTKVKAKNIESIFVVMRRKEIVDYIESWAKGIIAVKKKKVW